MGFILPAGGFPVSINQPLGNAETLPLQIEVHQYIAPYHIGTDKIKINIIGSCLF